MFDNNLSCCQIDTEGNYHHLGYFDRLEEAKRKVEEHVFDYGIDKY